MPTHDRIRRINSERYLPSSFDDSLTFLEKLNKLITHVNLLYEEIDTLSNRVKELEEK